MAEPFRHLGDFLRSRAIAFGCVDDHGAASAALFASHLSSCGIATTTRAVESWFYAERAPRIGRMERILDELGVHGDDRLLAYRLAARVEQDVTDEPAAPAVAS
jgi:hypothetical protein